MDYLMLHIEYLLLRHDCIIVPGFGALINRYEGAYYDEESSRYFPMRKVVSFNAMVTNDDGLLVNSYARYLKLSYSEARTILYKEIETLKNMLAENSVVPLSNVGDFSLTDDGRIIFRPKEDNSSLLGYSIVSAPVSETDNITENPASEIINHEKTPFSGKIEPVSAVSKIESDEESNHPSSKEYYTIRIPTRLMGYAAMILGLVAVTCLGIIMPTYDREIHHEASVFPATQIIETVKRNTFNTSDTVRQKPSMDSDSATDTPTSLDADNTEVKDYYLIVGTFRTTADAVKFINSVPADNLELIETPTLKRVAAASASSKDELLTLLNTPEFHSRYPEAWIWKQN